MLPVDTASDSVRVRSHSKPRVLLVSPSIVATFVRQDADLLRSEFDITLFPYMGWRSLPALRNQVRRADVILVWFAGRHALPAITLARRYRVSVAMVIGGYEVAWLPDIGYGTRPGSPHEWVLRRLLRASDVLLTVSEFNDRETRGRFPGLTGKVRCICHAVDSYRFQTDAAVTRRGILCVGNITQQTLTVKGWSLFRDMAQRLPSESFVAVGPTLDGAGRSFIDGLPRNVEWRGELTGDQLCREMQLASVYFQGSQRESFCMALAEAMACGCIPAVARRGALPEVAGDLGYYFDPDDHEDAINALKRALDAPPTQRLMARQRMIDLFGLERRRRELVETLMGILGHRS